MTTLARVASPYEEKPGPRSMPRSDFSECLNLHLLSMRLDLSSWMDNTSLWGEIFFWPIAATTFGETTEPDIAGWIAPDEAEPVSRGKRVTILRLLWQLIFPWEIVWAPRRGTPTRRRRLTV